MTTKEKRKDVATQDMTLVETPKYSAEEVEMAENVSH
jgi:hypothetical protein